MNKLLFFLFLTFLTIFSCQSIGVNNSYKKFKKIKTNEYIAHNYSGQEITKLDSFYNIFFTYRKRNINSFIRQKNIKNFVMNESFDRDDYSGNLIYFSMIITKDSIFKFSCSSLKEVNFSKMKTNSRSDDLYFIFKQDSIFVSRNFVYLGYDFQNVGQKVTNNSYISNYRNGKLDQFTINDSIIYKRKGSKMDVDFNAITWET